MRTCIVRILEIIIEIRRQVVACPRLIFFFLGGVKAISWPFSYQVKNQ